MKKIIAAIPVRNNLKWTAPLVEQLLLGDDVTEVWIYDNGSRKDTEEWVKNRALIDSRLMYLDMKHLRLYDMWSRMIKEAATIKDCRLAILNNDIRLPHMALKIMAESMDGYQIATVDPSKSSFDPIEALAAIEVNWQDKVGYAFMVDPEFWKDVQDPIAPSLRIWWGDDDLFRRAQERGGRICRLMGLGINHSQMSSDSEYPGDKWADVELDRAEFARLWND